MLTIFQKTRFLYVINYVMWIHFSALESSRAFNFLKFVSLPDAFYASNAIYVRVYALTLRVSGDSFEVNIRMRSCLFHAPYLTHYCNAILRTTGKDVGQKNRKSHHEQRENKELPLFRTQT